MAAGSNPKRNLEIQSLALFLFACCCVWLIVQSTRRPKEKEVKAEQIKPIVLSFALSDADWQNAQTPFSKDKAALGAKLFVDPALSKNGKVSCLTCHNPNLYFTDQKPTSIGVHQTKKNSPTILNSRFQNRFFWNGRADSLAAQSFGPLTHPDEQGLSHMGLARVIRQKYRKDYETLFEPWPPSLNATVVSIPARIPQKDVVVSDEVAAYALSKISYTNLKKLLEYAQTERKKPTEMLVKYLIAPKRPEVAAEEKAFNKLPLTVQTDLMTVVTRTAIAIEAFEKNQMAMNSPFDRFVDVYKKKRQPKEAFHATFGEQEFAGLKIFVEKKCQLCHSGSRFTDDQFHNIGLGQVENETFPDLGRSEGMQIVTNDVFNCQGPYLPQPTKMEPPTEGCMELNYLNLDSLEAVGAFKTPSLRNVAKTAPYFHDGRAATLDDVLDHYQDLAAEPVIGHREESLVPLKLNDQDRQALKAFLNSLTSEVTDLSL